MRPVSHQEQDKCCQQGGGVGLGQGASSGGNVGFRDGFASELGADLEPASALECFSLLLFLDTLISQVPLGFLKEKRLIKPTLPCYFPGRLFLMCQSLCLVWSEHGWAGGWVLGWQQGHQTHV